MKKETIWVKIKHISDAAYEEGLDMDTSYGFIAKKIRDLIEEICTEIVGEYQTTGSGKEFRNGLREEQRSRMKEILEGNK